MGDEPHLSTTPISFLGNLRDRCLQQGGTKKCSWLCSNGRMKVWTYILWEMIQLVSLPLSSSSPNSKSTLKIPSRKMNSHPSDAMVLEATVVPSATPNVQGSGPPVFLWKEFWHAREMLVLYNVPHLKLSAWKLDFI